MNEDESLENDADLVPVKDDGYYIPGDYVPNFHHDRLIIGKMSREDLEDRYLVIFEDNFKLKKNTKEQEDKIKKLATKLIRVLSDKKRIEMGSRTGLVTSPSSGRLKDPETENFIEDQNQRIRELEKENSHLRDKFHVAKTQLLSLQPNYSPTSIPNYRAKRFHSQKPNSYMMYNLPSTSPIHMLNPQPANGNNNLNQQAHRLLEEARNENRMLEETIMTLKERISIFEQEVDLVKEQSKIKESNLEEEIDHLKSEMSEGHRDKPLLKKKNRREAVDLSAQLQEEQKKALSSNNEKSNSVILKQTIKESEEKINDLKKENLILREHNERLLNSAFDLERERQYQATENSLKLKIAQLESTMKNDLTDKKGLSDALEKQREAYSKLEIEFEDVRSKFYKLKQLNEDNDEGSKESSFQGSPFDPREIEEALFYLRQKKDQTLMGYPSFMTEIDNKKDFNIAELKKEISEIQVQYVDTQKKEIESLHKRITGVKSEYLSQISEFKKLLDMRANRILKLENQIRENAYVSVRSNHRQKSGAQCSSFMSSNEVSLHTPSGQSLFEIHISKVSLIPNAVTAINDEHLNIFATWCFYDNEMQYSPVIQGPEASLDCSSYYKVKLKDEFLEYLKEGYMVVEIHLATDDESDKENSCRTIASARINLSQVLEYPSNKLHGSVMVYSTSGVRETSNILGTLDFWFKLHTAATNRIVQWLECKKRNRKEHENFGVQYEKI
ncbi:RPGRIP1L [Lepeophtheirus salmonis]|uniref:RPGRIP1L n=1 Tax=Lepeophtheirus salmonis TaxID=72036 RepID=A0A7R8CWB2_LEPSM|nr:RPGRIP1L [Lepeophtheirus salmonis]CAF2950744.1 RPGRIP1L [Lepeophtheirus salmonis]